ncbi:HTH-type transcriptional regulator ArgP [Hydrogenophaga sp. YM1]|jgi:LysR family transcriptional regulator (chromosome initiation inhibitor)|uniref:ArgP/LysG family DNA-binding transcriptional regulator n=1 Tax=Hydrogenophaga borbori TaxID=2294117 RepID=A0A372EIR4_9BURK|nr:MULTISPECIES: HTH-type transcriptional regulator ArgP [Hydrogenophaga]NCT99484.1 ArgP/LysG family DNA-binding transcriptional regulator [Comamonadaceae bacterium]ODT34414.1 MAG: transcriptional regulator ArgP [Hydrogenophaga sp. SCN 70-13]MBN9373687.1 HTH-type transcriptional regulator ArgP [Hydrogenophaga sp.]OJV67041.1 MAG: transcriptional regulator ArgP [Hydrogenophaga sp. 70-12]QRR34640.1 HTH-type transcriptional regulator ArgP [Hydrogenophaga sp. YM1]
MLDPRPLEALAAVVEHGGFGPAARALQLTLAAVSLRIKSLEDQLGQRLLVRGKRVRATPAGQALLGHVKQVRLMEADLLAGLVGGEARAGERWQSLSVAINADSVSSWFLPAVAPLLARQRLLLEVVIDDQDHTHDALKRGDVVGCVTTRADAMRGCVAEPLGVMRYHCVATPAVVQRCRTPRGAVSPHRLLAQPAVIFNRKDALQDAFLEQHIGLRQPAYPRHYVPAVEAFETAIELGMGWGMVPEQHLPKHPALTELLPGATVDVALYWQHWTHEPPSAQRLTAAVKAAARERLAPLAGPAGPARAAT